MYTNVTYIYSYETNINHLVLQAKLQLEAGTFCYFLS